MAALLLVQHIIAPPPPSLEDEELPPVPVGRVLLDEFLRAVNNALSSQHRGPFEAEIAHTACSLFEGILVEGGPSTKELASRIQLEGGPGKSDYRGITQQMFRISSSPLFFFLFQMGALAFLYWTGRYFLSRRALSVDRISKKYRWHYYVWCPYG